MAAAWAGGVRYFDTAPWYGNTLAEHRLGHFLRQQPRGELRDLDQGRARLSPLARAGRPAARPLGGRPAVRAPLRLHLRRRDALLRGQPAPARPGPGRPPGDPRRRPRLSRRRGRHRALLSASSRRRRPARAAGAEVGGRDQRLRRRDQRGADDRPLPRALRPRLLPGRDAVHPARPGAPRRRLPALRRARHRHRHRLALRLGHPRDRRRSQGARYNYAPAAPEILGKTRRIEAVCRAPRRAARRRRAPVPARPPGGRRDHPGRGATPPRSSRTSTHLRTPIPADLWAELKAEGLLHPDAPVPS